MGGGCAHPWEIHVYIYFECTGEVRGLSSWEGVCLNKCQRAQKLVPRAEDKTCKAEMRVYMYVCLCVREREILAQVQSWNSLGFPIPAVVVTAFLVHLVSIRVVFSFHCIILDASLTKGKGAMVGVRGGTPLSYVFFLLRWGCGLTSPILRDMAKSLLFVLGLS